MQTAKVFRNGNSQAVRLPKEFRFDDDEVIVAKVGDAVMLFPKNYRADSLAQALGELDPDFQLEREQPRAPETRNFDS